MNNTLLFAIFLALSVTPTFGQVVRAESKALDRVIKREGWTIPKISEEELFSNQITRIENNPVTLKEYKPKKNVDFQLDHYFLDANNTLISSQRVYEVRSISSFSVNNKVFAYGVIGVPFAVDERGNKAAYIGAVVKVYYFDEDGDGKLETRYISIKPPNIIPNWVIKPKAN
jgi:hypothetical protein